MEIPKNCRECTRANECKAWHYGSDKCEYKDVIYAIHNLKNN